MTGPEPRELLGKALLEIRSLKARLKELEAARHEPIAIVGYGCRFPGAPDPAAFWRLLRDGVDAVREVPRDRFDIDAWYDPDPDQPGKIYTRSAAFLDQVDGFDAGFFGISPREVENLSLQQRLLLEVTWEALEDANVVPAALYGSTTGVFVGQCGFDEGPWNTSGTQRPEDVDLYSLTGSTLSITAGRLSYLLGVTGPSLVVDTACSSSLVALQLACQSLRAGECDRALAGGVHVLTSPAIMLGLCRIKALAPDGRSKSFDARSDGYGRGEGCGVVLLRRLSDALAAGDRIHAVIRGIAINQDGASGGLTVPSGPSQSAVIRHALADGGVDPAQLGYVEAHGTGTSLGDPIEMRALQAVYAAHSKERPLFVGSVKSNVGHLEAAAGVAGLLKVVLALEHGVIPPSLHFQNPNPHIPWASIPVTVPTQGIPWPERGGRPIAGLSSFGLGGTNVHVVLEAPPPLPPAPASSWLRSHPILLLSGRDEKALQAAAAQFGQLLDADPKIDLAALCHVAATGRTHFAERAALPATSHAELRARLQELAHGQLASTGEHDGRGRRDEARLPELLFHFSGDDAAPTALRESLERQLSLAALLRSFGVEPDFVLGSGIGEVAAAIEAGVVGLTEGLHWCVANAQRNAAGGAEALAQLIATTPLAPPRRKLLSQLSGTEAGDEIATPAYWLRALRNPPATHPALSGVHAQRGPSTAAAERPRPQLLVELGAASGPGAGAALVALLARLHVHGATVDWARVEGGANRRAASLPTYPFQRHVYPRALAMPAGKSAESWHSWLHESRWIPSPAPAEAKGAAGRWLLLLDRGGFGEQLLAALAARGAACTALRATDATAPRSAADVARLLAGLGSEPVRGVVHLLGLDAQSGDLGRAALARGARDECESALGWIQALARASLRGAPRLWIVTRGAVAVSGPDRIEPLQALLWGLGRSIAMEAPERWGGLVDLDPALEAAAPANVSALVRQLLAPPQEERLALRGGQRLGERVARCPAGASAPLVLRADATYLITGGLGGIGLALAERLVARGARHLLLLGRRAPTAEATAALRRLEERGCKIVVERADVAQATELQRVLDDARRRGPPLRGIFHSAGVVADVALAQLTWTDFEMVLESKLHGTANLHRLTEGLELDHFVLFSSAVSLLGSVGQANYSAASAYLDALVHQRRARNLPGLAIQWGAWSEVGLARSEPILRGLRERGFDAMTNADALAAFEWAVGQPRPRVAVVPVTWPRFLEQLPPGSPQSLFADMAGASAATTATGAATTAAEPAALRAELDPCSPTERRRLLRKHVADQVAAVLRLPAGQALDEELGFFQLGMNSLTTVELRRRVGKPLGIAVSATMVFDHPTVRGLSARLEQELFGAVSEAAVAPPPPPPRGAPSDDVNRLLDEELAALKGLLPPASAPTTPEPRR